jgi:GNAT superfamily N-acetyltransferase
MIRLVPMTKVEFDDFLEGDIRLFAEENVRSGYWDKTGALEKSRREHKRLLPDGMVTRNHYFYTIRKEDDTALGTLWMKVDLSSQAKPFGFIHNLEIHKPFLEKDYAAQAMLELEKIASGFGLKQLNLLVFAHNEDDQSFYERLGYSVKSMFMIKPLDNKK